MADELIARIDARSARVAIVGQGYVGLVVAMRASEAGFAVTGHDVDGERVAALRAGRSYVEDVPDAVLRAALERGYRPTADPDDLAGFDVAVISVPTPLHEGLPDLRAIEKAAAVVGRHLGAGSLVVLESTTYPGTTEELVAPILEGASGLVTGRDFLLGYSPERIDPGNATFGLHNTPKVVAGVDAASLRAVEAFFGAFVEKLVPVRGPGEAELTKLIENTFRHVNIALINELARFASDLGVDVWEAIDAAATKPFGFMPFRPGPGVGGHCLPVDPSYLSWRVRRRLGETFRFVELANEVNQHMPHYVVARIQAQLNGARLAVNGARIVVLGAAYKPGVGDARESPSIPIVERLRGLGAEVTVVDPYVVRLAGIPLTPELSPELVRGADLVAVITDHPDFDYDMVVREAVRIFDARNRLAGIDAPHIERL